MFAADAIIAGLPYRSATIISEALDQMRGILIAHSLRPAGSFFGNFRSACRRPTPFTGSDCGRRQSR
jgi:hypothetical protein